MSPKAVRREADKDRLAVHFELLSELALVSKKSVLDAAVRFAEEADGRRAHLRVRRDFEG